MPEQERPAPTTEVGKRVREVIDDLAGGKVTAPDRTDLRKAIDKAEAPLTGRAKSDHALGHLSGNRRP